MLFITFNLQTNGRIEVVNKSLCTLLMVILKGNKKSWDELIKFAYN